MRGRIIYKWIGLMNFGQENENFIKLEYYENGISFINKSLSSLKSVRLDTF